MRDQIEQSQKLQRILDELRKPFHPSHVSWKPGAVKGDRALALAYADLRAYMNRLDEVCGPDWSIEYEPWGEDRIICKLTICGVTRSSTGESNKESDRNEIGGTVAEAQAAKRACAFFGLGRYLYTLPTGWADYDPATKRFTEKAKAKLTGILMQHYRRATDPNNKGLDDLYADAPQHAASDAEAQTHTQAQPAAQGAAVQATEGASEAWYVVARRTLTNGTALLADKMLAMHRDGQGPCTPAQYRFLSGLIDSLPGVDDDGHNKVLSIICQSEISSVNPPSFDLATKLLDYLPTHIKVDGNKVENPNYRADVVEHIGKIANALQMDLGLAA